MGRICGFASINVEKRQKRAACGMKKGSRQTANVENMWFCFDKERKQTTQGRDRRTLDGTPPPHFASTEIRSVPPYVSRSRSGLPYSHVDEVDSSFPSIEMCAEGLVDDRTKALHTGTKHCMHLPASGPAVLLECRLQRCTAQAVRQTLMLGHHHLRACPCSHTASVSTVGESTPSTALVAAAEGCTRNCCGRPREARPMFCSRYCNMKEKMPRLPQSTGSCVVGASHEGSRWRPSPGSLAQPTTLLPRDRRPIVIGVPSSHPSLELCFLSFL